MAILLATHRAAACSHWPVVERVGEAETWARKQAWGRIMCLRPERGHKCYFHTISLSSDQTDLRGVEGGSWRQVFALAFKDPRTESSSTPARPHLESG